MSAKCSIFVVVGLHHHSILVPDVNTTQTDVTLQSKHGLQATGIETQTPHMHKTSIRKRLMIVDAAKGT